MEYARAPMLLPRRVELDASSLAVKMSAAEASGTPLIFCSCFLSSSVRILPNSESAISSDFNMDPSLLLVRGVLPSAVTDILGQLQSITQVVQVAVMKEQGAGIDESRA
jgi:hypothetical protein